MHVCVCEHLRLCVFRCAMKSCYFYGFPCATIVILSIPADRHICFVHVHQHCIQEFPNELFWCAGMCWCLRACVCLLCDSDTIAIQEYKNRTCGHGKNGQRTTPTICKCEINALFSLCYSTWYSFLFFFSIERATNNQRCEFVVCCMCAFFFFLYSKTKFTIRRIVVVHKAAGW